MDETKGLRSVLDLKIGETATIKKLADHDIALKLMGLGVIPAARLTLVSRSPMGAATCIRLGDTLIAIRKSEARSILIT